MRKAINHISLLPPIIKLLLISNILVFLFELYAANQLITVFALWPVVPDQLAFNSQINSFKLWQLISYSFLHGNLTHLLLNMYALWLFGVQLENLWGSRIFAIYYFVCVIGAGLVQLLVSNLGIQDGAYYPTIGASGGVFGVLLAFGMFFPNRILILLIPPIPIKAKWFVLIYGIIELWFGISGTATGIAHFAHLGGMLFGLLLIYYWKIYPPGRPD